MAVVVMMVMVTAAATAAVGAASVIAALALLLLLLLLLLPVILLVMLAVEVLSRVFVAVVRGGMMGMALMLMAAPPSATAAAGAGNTAGARRRGRQVSAWSWSCCSRGRRCRHCRRRLAILAPISHGIRPLVCIEARSGRRDRRSCSDNGCLVWILLMEGSIVLRRRREMVVVGRLLPRIRLLFLVLLRVWLFFKVVVGLLVSTLLRAVNNATTVVRCSERVP